MNSIPSIFGTTRLETPDSIFFLPPFAVDYLMCNNRSENHKGSMVPMEFLGRFLPQLRILQLCIPSSMTTYLLLTYW